MKALRPNILYLHSHDTGRYIQPYGCAVPTPAYQRLAEQGMVFRRCFSAAPTCSASRAALLTGQAPHSAGMIGLAHRGFTLKDYSQHLVHTLRGAGYRSTLIGVQHVAPRADLIGYDEVVPVASTHAKDVGPAAVDFLRRTPREPFFLSVGFFETHRDWDDLAAKADGRFVRPPATVADTPVTRRDMAGFVEKARRLDAAVGDILDALDSAGLADRTLVLATTDHGLAFPGMKCTLTDHGIGVFLILRGPGGFEGGRVSDALVSHEDLFPTLCDLLGMAPPPWLQGTSLLPIVRGKKEEVRGELYAGVTYHAAYEPMRAVRTERWKYIRRFGGRTRPVLPNTDDSPSKTAWLEAGLAGRPVAPEELYDLVFDPNEAHNLAAEPSAAKVLQDMRGRLERWMKRTDDPLLAGPVPAPKGAWFNDVDGLSPKEPGIIA